jgi:hypothetical protein
LRDAAYYITKLPKAEHDTKEWQAAMQALLLVAERDGDPMFARIGVMQGKRFSDHTGRPDRLDEWSRSGREARSVLVGPGPRQ